MVDSPTNSAKAYLGCYPTAWEFVPAGDDVYAIRLAGHSYVLDSYGIKNGTVIHVWHENLSIAHRTWRFERLGSLPGAGPGLSRLEMVENNHIISQMLEQLAQKDKHLAELADQLANQTQKIVDLEKTVFTQKRQIEEKDQQLAQANSEVRYMLARVAQREGRVVGPDSSRVGETVQGEVALLRDKFERLEILVNQVRPQY